MSWATLPKTKVFSSTSRFLGLLDRYAAYVNGAGKKVYRAAPVEGERMFLALSEDHRHRLVTRLEAELGILDETVASGERVTDSPRLLWRYLRTTGYTPCSDIFSRISDTDIVEVYGPEQIHLFQNLNFFDWVSATLEQIYCETWYQNSRRDPGIEQQIGMAARRVLTGESGGTLYPAVAWHVVRENGAEDFEFDFHLKWVSPVTSAGRITGLIAVGEAANLRASKSGGQGPDPIEIT